MLDKNLAIRWYPAGFQNLRTLQPGPHGSCGIGSQADCFRLLLPLHDPAGEGGADCSAADPPAGPWARPVDLRLAACGCGQLLLSFDGAVVRAALRHRRQPLPPDTALARQVPLDTPPAASLLSLCRWLTKEMEQPGSFLRTRSAVSASLERALLALFVELLVSGNAAVVQGPQDLAECHVCRIEAWIEANLDRDIGIDDLAAAAGTSGRSVQAAFRRLRGCTPLQAVQRRRLEQARRLLEAAAPQTSVTGTALDCGFSHLGRFSIAFHSLFGEKPSQTLARSRAQQRSRLPFRCKA
jgi:AraC-like DNA-binding protein